jgi:hypothetical protein
MVRTTHERPCREIGRFWTSQHKERPVSYDAWKLATPPEYELLGPEPEDDEPEYDIDVCQHCGGYFAWTPHHREVAHKHDMVGAQRCIRCIKNDAWIETDSS